MTTPAHASPAPGLQLTRLRQIVAKLRAPDGCPWDREQTHATLRSSAIEEAYEVVEAIDLQDDSHLKEELGDLLLQVVMHAQIAAESGRFDLEDVAAAVSDKLVRRHPHVFGETRLADSDAVLKQWDEIKRVERAQKGAAPDASALDGVSQALPALMRAEKIQKRAARVGFDWDNLPDVLEKIREELREVEQEIAREDQAAFEDELGDLLFSVVNLTRKARFEAEMLLNRATQKFIRRFHSLEAQVRLEHRDISQMTLPELDQIWKQVKERE